MGPLLYWQAFAPRGLRRGARLAGEEPKGGSPMDEGKKDEVKLTKLTSKGG